MLVFKPVTINSFSEILPYLHIQHFRTCDFTVGGIYMWIDYFQYEYCIADQLLFIKGYAEEEIKKIAFSIPIGHGKLEHGISLLREYCEHHQLPLLLSAVPEEGKADIEALSSCTTIPLPNWSDYLYDRDELITLRGRKFNKKRNRVNKFYNDYSDISHESINETNIDEVQSFFLGFSENNQKKSPYFAYEEAMVSRVLENYFQLNFIGRILKVNNRIVAISIGEVINDTLFVHIEKASKEYTGAYEAINTLFAQEASALNDIQYVNREEDVGDEGLRKAKLAYNPIRLLSKYNITL